MCARFESAKPPRSGLFAQRGRDAIRRRFHEVCKLSATIKDDVCKCVRMHACTYVHVAACGTRAGFSRATIYDLRIRHNSSARLSRLIIALSPYTGQVRINVGIAACACCRALLRICKYRDTVKGHRRPKEINKVFITSAFASLKSDESRPSLSHGEDLSPALAKSFLFRLREDFRERIRNCNSNSPRSEVAAAAA